MLKALLEFLREDELFEINKLLGACEVVNDAEE